MDQYIPTNPPLLKPKNKFIAFIDQLKAKRLLPQKTSPGLVVAILIFLLTVLGVSASMLLLQSNQDIRQQASGGTYGDNHGCSSDDQCQDGMACISTPYGRVCKAIEGPNAVSGGICGDSVCDALETLSSCPKDCDPSVQVQNNITGCGGSIKPGTKTCVKDTVYECFNISEGTQQWRANGEVCGSAVKEAALQDIGEACIATYQCMTGLVCSANICKEIQNFDATNEADRYTRCEESLGAIRYNLQKRDCNVNSPINSNGQSTRIWSDAVCSCVASNSDEGQSAAQGQGGATTVLVKVNEVAKENEIDEEKVPGFCIRPTGQPNIADCYVQSSTAEDCTGDSYFAATQLEVEEQRVLCIEDTQFINDLLTENDRGICYSSNQTGACTYVEGVRSECGGVFAEGYTISNITSELTQSACESLQSGDSLGHCARFNEELRLCEYIGMTNEEVCNGYFDTTSLDGNQARSACQEANANNLTLNCYAFNNANNPTACIDLGVILVSECLTHAGGSSSLFPAGAQADCEGKLPPPPNEERWCSVPNNSNNTCNTFVTTTSSCNNQGGFVASTIVVNPDYYDFGIYDPGYPEVIGKCTASFNTTGTGPGPAVPQEVISTSPNLSSLLASESEEAELPPECQIGIINNVITFFSPAYCDEGQEPAIAATGTPPALINQDENENTLSLGESVQFIVDSFLNAFDSLFQGEPEVSEETTIEPEILVNETPTAEIHVESTVDPTRIPIIEPSTGQVSAESFIDGDGRYCMNNDFDICGSLRNGNVEIENTDAGWCVINRNTGVNTTNQLGLRICSGVSHFACSKNGDSYPDYFCNN